MTSQAFKSQKVCEEGLEFHLRAKSVPLDELSNTLTSNFAKNALLRLGQGEDMDEEVVNSPKHMEETDVESQYYEEEEVASPMFTVECIKEEDQQPSTQKSRKSSLVTYDHVTNAERHNEDYCETLGSQSAEAEYLKEIQDKIEQLKIKLERERANTHQV